MLPLLRPILYLPLIGQQTRTKQDTKEIDNITINEFKNSNNQDTLYEDPPLATADTSDSHFNIQNKKALMQELV